MTDEKKREACHGDCHGGCDGCPAHVPEEKRNPPRRRRRAASARQIGTELIQLRTYEDAGWLGGVCAGLAYYLSFPTWIVRLVWFVTFAVFGVGIVAYVVLWVLIPNAKTPRDYVAITGDEADS